MEFFAYVVNQRKFIYMQHIIAFEMTVETFGRIAADCHHGHIGLLSTIGCICLGAR